MIPIRRLIAACAAAALAIVPVAATAQEYAEGQGEADYQAWLARDPDARAKVIAFKQYLEMQELGEVLPTYQLVRTASMWRECNGPRFEVAPFTMWPRIAKTLTFITRHVEPVIGEVEALSGYRNPVLNACAKGAPRSAHQNYYALDLTPLKAISREGMIRSICAIHAFRGTMYDIGLGFYSGRRFHVDSKGFRKWGPDGKGATSPCNA